MYKRIVLFAMCLSIASAENPLSFTEAFKLRLEVDNDISAMVQLQAASELDVDLVGALSNTEFESVLENFGHDEIELGVMQVFEVPSIRKSRRLLAESELGGLDVELEYLKVQIHHDLSMYFLKAARLDQELRLSRNRLEMSKRILNWQEHQHNEGALSESELIRTRYEIAELDSEVKRLELSQRHLADELGIYLGKEVSAEDLVIGFPGFPDSELITRTWDQLDTSPAIKQQLAQLSVLKATIQTTKTPLISSVGVSAGMKMLPELNQRFPIVGFSIETPLFSKRSKAVEQSEYRLRSGMEKLESINANMEISSKHWLNEWNISSHQLNSIQQVLIPEAERLYGRIEDEYRAGARQYLEVLNTQAILTDLQQKELELHSEMAALLFEMNLTLGVTIYEFN